MYERLIKGADLDKDRIDLYKSRGYRLFKTLLSDACRMDCLYCPFSIHCIYERRMWDLEQLVKTFLDSYRSRRVDGFFLTSSLFSEPDKVVEKQIMVIERIRRLGYKGYIHLRLMPGTSKDLIYHAAVLSDRAGVNIEAPKDAFHEIAPSKGDWVQDIIKRLEWLVYLKRKFRKQGPHEYGYLSSGVDTQIMVGVLNETDLEILETVHKVLSIGVDKVYVSPFIPYKGTPLENRKPPPRWRALRIMQAIELMRVYGYSLDEIKTIIGENDMLPNKDPKVAYAEIHKDIFPVDLNNDPYELILKVPGIGPKTARKIMELRSRGTRIDEKTLARIVPVHRLRKILKYITF